MDKWTCPHCGEELLGAANRCWKCGQRVRRPLPAPTEVLVAQFAGPVPAVQLTAEEVAIAVTKPPPRRGSPFAVESTLSTRGPVSAFYGDGPYREVKPHPNADRPLRPQYPRNEAAIGGVTAALLLGGFSLVLLYFTVLGGLTALIGVGCAVWGLFSRRKGLAIGALILCCLALTLAAWKTGFLLYDRLIQPTIPPVVMPPGP